MGAAEPRRGTQKWGAKRRARVKRSLLRKYGPICQWCFRKIDVTVTDAPWRWSVDHIVEWSAGGTNDIANLQPMHYRCNIEKEEVRVRLLGHTR